MDAGAPAGIARALACPPMETVSFVVPAGRKIEILAFDLSDDDGVHLGTFRVLRRQRFDVLRAFSQAIGVKEGQRVYDVLVLHSAVVQLVTDKVYDTETGGWVDVDDRDRMAALVNDPTVNLDVEMLGEIVSTLLMKVTAHPTGASRPSAPGRENTEPGPPADSSSPAENSIPTTETQP